MSNDTKNTPEDDKVRQQVEEMGQTMDALVKLLERNGHKVATLTVEFEDDPQQQFDLHPEDDPAVGADDNGAPDRDEDPRH